MKKSFIPKYKNTIKWKRPKPQGKIDYFISDIIDEDIKKTDLNELQRLLKFYEQRLESLQKEQCPQPNDETFGGPASQWGIKHNNDIQIYKRQIDMLKIRIKELNNNER